MPRGTERTLVAALGGVFARWLGGAGVGRFDGGGGGTTMYRVQGSGGGDGLGVGGASVDARRSRSPLVEEKGDSFKINSETDNQLNYAINLLKS